MNHTVAGKRLQHQRITRVGPRDPAKLVAWLGAVQAQEFGPAKWGLGLRMPPGTTDARIQRAFDAGRILRTHVLRPTWHFVTPADIRWMLELSAPHVHRTMSTYDRRLGLTPGVMNRATTIMERALRDGAYLTRVELGEHLARAGLPGKTMHLAHIAMYAELEGVICSGPRRGKQSTYALLDHRAPNARRLPREEAMAELAKRFLRSHGPATARDFSWWSGLAAADAKRAIDMNRPRRLDVDGRTYWTLGPASRGARIKGVRLLPIYDEYLVAYRDREAVPHGPALDASRGGGYGTFQHAVVIDGQVAGTWRTGANSKGVAVTVLPLNRIGGTAERALRDAVARYSRFLEAPVSLSLIRPA